MFLARPKGFEPLTPRFVVWCSIQLSYGRGSVEGNASKAEKPALGRPAAPYRVTPGLARRGAPQADGSRGSIGRKSKPSMSSMSFAPASSFASPLAGATICNPTGRLSRVNPQGSDKAAAPASVIA